MAYVTGELLRRLATKDLGERSSPYGEERAMWIVVDDGDVFEGTFEQFAGAFFAGKAAISHQEVLEWVEQTDVSIVAYVLPVTLYSLVKGEIYLYRFFNDEAAAIFRNAPPIIRNCPGHHQKLNLIREAQPHLHAEISCVQSALRRHGELVLSITTYEFVQTSK